MVEKKEKALEDYVPDDRSKGLAATKDAKPVVLREVLEDMDLIGPHVKAETLHGEKFSIYRAKPFKSSYEPFEDVYFCHCLDMEKAEIFTTVLGGGAVVELLELYFKHGPGAPIMVTLNWNEGGTQGGYYTID